jgi:protein-S-isoprenylcysteine O-methyltransferase Ste14
MTVRRPAYPIYVLFVGVLWGCALPGILILDAGGSIPWRDAPLAVLGLLVIFLGLVVVAVAARRLGSAGIGLFGVRPGPVLVTDGVYARVRNPIDIGTVFIAFGQWIALGLELAWVIPAAALVSFVAGVGPYEDRLLVEEFGDTFRTYRKSVSKWWPRMRSDSE